MNFKIKFLIPSSLAIICFGIWLLIVGVQDEPFISYPSPHSGTMEVVSEHTDSGQTTSSATLGIKEEGILVTEVIDGDTFRLETGETVRMVGIDTPETVDPRRPVGCFGKEASNETKSLLTNKRVILQKDITDKDKYGRILRLVYLILDNGDLLFVNDYLVRDGFAKAYTYPPDIKYDSKFKDAEAGAKMNKKGMWEKCVKLR